MPFILVFANDSSCRRLFVDNLVMRGYVAVGSASVNEAHTLLEHQLPELIVVCCVHSGQEETIVELRNLPALDNVPILIASADPPDREWMKAWHVSSALPYPMDLRKLVQYLKPWLEPLSENRSGSFPPPSAFQLKAIAL
jgi:DNA-binding response OmpR family regulator